jgi:hypothetical protein
VSGPRATWNRYGRRRRGGARDLVAAEFVAYGKRIRRTFFEFGRSRSKLCLNDGVSGSYRVFNLRPTVQFVRSLASRTSRDGLRGSLHSPGGSSPSKCGS